MSSHSDLSDESDSIGKSSDPPTLEVLLESQIPAVRWRVFGLLSPKSGAAEKLPAGPFAVRDDEVIVGRQPDLAIALNDHSISRRHARLSRSGDDFTIDDLNSANGTFVNGVPVVSCRLHDGDVIQLGSCRFWFDRIIEPCTPEPADRPRSHV